MLDLLSPFFIVRMTSDMYDGCMQKASNGHNIPRSWRAITLKPMANDIVLLSQHKTTLVLQRLFHPSLNLCKVAAIQFLATVHVRHACTAHLFSRKHCCRSPRSPSSHSQNAFPLLCVDPALFNVYLLPATRPRLQYTKRFLLLPPICLIASNSAWRT